MIRKVKYKKGIFIQLLLLPLLAVLIVGTGSYVIYMGEMGKRLNISLEAAAEQLENRIDNVIYNVSKIYLEAADNAAVKNLSGQDAMDIFYVGLKDTLSELQGGPSRSPGRCCRSAAGPPRQRWRRLHGSQ